MTKKRNAIYDHERSMSEPDKPDELIEDTGDMSPDPKSPTGRLFALTDKMKKKGD